jgi:exosortase O
MTSEPWPFTPGELSWLSADGPLSAGRWRFEWQGYTGSLLLITSDTWRAHHRPERCFEAYGLTVEQSYSRLLQDDFPFRQVALSAPRRSDRYTAVYWLQAPGRLTDDYATRIWSDLSPQRQTWVLVTILFDRSIDPLDSDLHDMYAGLRQSIDVVLQGGSPK